MEAGNKLIYDGQFQGNILVVFGKYNHVLAIKSNFILQQNPVI